MDGPMLSVIILSGLLISQVEAEFCYRKLHGRDDTLPGGSVCRGKIERKSFSSSRACCSSKGAVAYSTSLVTLGKRALKYRCTPCPKDTEIVPDIFLPTGTDWSEWGQWTACTVTCEMGMKTRQRYCQDSDPTACEGDAQETIPCVEKAQCPVDGQWGPWRGWSDCSQTCGGGTRNRTRLCNNPRPEFGGLDCAGDETEIEECSSQGCPVDGSWSEWSSDGVCSVTCGKGRLTKTRMCDSPLPQYGGKFCAGSDTKTEICQLGVKCPVDGGWSLWSRYSPCSGTCGEGSRSRTRRCIAPSPRFGGEKCKGDSSEIQTCYHHYPCPIDGDWSDWGSWGQCLVRPCMNETGVQTRTRTCTNPQPQFLGQKCEGTTMDSKPCVNNDNCPVHGGWCSWSEFSDCRVSEKKSFMIKTRDCLCPKPENGGRLCHGDDFRLEACNEHSGSILPDVDDEGSGYKDDDEDY